MTQEDDASLARFLALLGQSDCTCQYGWRKYGRLYGEGWVRLDTNPTCPHHGAARPRP